MRSDSLLRPTIINAVVYLYMTTMIMVMRRQG